jgi:CBS domain-containing protein
MKHHLVSDWMTRDPHTVSSWTTLLDAYQIMKAYDIRRLPVLEDDKLVGIITLNNIRSAVPEQPFNPVRHVELLANQPVADVMTPNPIAIHPNASLAEAAEIMYENKFGGLPVVENGKLIGIITESDFFRLVMIEARKGSE